MSGPQLYIMAGPNGAGKTTFAKEFLPDYAKCPYFVNADLIAQGLSPFSPMVAAMKAGRLVLEQIEAYAKRKVDFAFETTLAGKSYVRLFKRLRATGYQLHIFFLWIPSPELALLRIRDRVAEGGHDVPAADVRRRFRRGIQNLSALYRPLANSWILFDNAGHHPRLVAEEKHQRLTIVDESSYRSIVGGAG